MTRTKLGFLTVGLTLAGVLIGARVAISQKAAPAATAAAAPAAVSNKCERCDAMAVEKAQKAVSMIVEAGHWTKADHDKVGPLFHTLHTEQKIEILKRVGALIDQKKLVVDKGARLF